MNEKTTQHDENSYRMPVTIISPGTGNIAHEAVSIFNNRTAPSMGRRIKPNLPSLDGNPTIENHELLNVPSLEWAGRRKRSDFGGIVKPVEYEFIGKDESLISLGIAQPNMLPVENSSGLKCIHEDSGSHCRLQRLAGQRTRLEFWAPPLSTSRLRIPSPCLVKCRSPPDFATRQRSLPTGGRDLERQRVVLVADRTPEGDRCLIFDENIDGQSPLI